MRTILRALLACALTGTLTGCTFLKVNVTEEVQPFVEQVISGEGADKVLVIDLSGIIMEGERSQGLAGKKRPGMIANVREALQQARADKSVRAVVLRINSPGGGVTASDTLYHEIKVFREASGIPVVAHIMDIGTSGAYYAALAADTITAQPTSVTGSIGVILVRVDATGLLEKAGLTATEIVSGARKGMGSPFRRMNDDERKIFQDIIDSLYRRFSLLVAESRKLPAQTVHTLADGRIFTSAAAKTAGLIDRVGYLDDAIDLAKQKAGIKHAKVIMYRRPGEYRSSIYSMQLINLDLGALADPGARFLYLWWP